MSNSSLKELIIQRTKLDREIHAARVKLIRMFVIGRKLSATTQHLIDEVNRRVNNVAYNCEDFDDLLDQIDGILNHLEE